MSIYLVGGNWSNNMNIVMDIIDFPNTTGTVDYRPEFISNNGVTLYWGYNQPGYNGNDYAAAPCYLILEEIDNSVLTTYDGQAS